MRKVGFQDIHVKKYTITDMISIMYFSSKALEIVHKNTYKRSFVPIKTRQLTQDFFAVSTLQEVGSQEIKLIPIFFSHMLIVIRCASQYLLLRGKLNRQNITSVFF